MRVFLGGIVTETNTLSPIPTGADDWQVVRDLAAAESCSALEAFAQEAAARGDELAFGLYAFAMPAANTTCAAWAGLRDELLGMLEATMPVDAVLLPLPGAMVADGVDAGSVVDDAEGELIAAEVVYMAAPGAVAPIMEQIPLVRADLHKYPWVEAPFGEG